MHVHNHTRISTLQCVLKVCRAEYHLQERSFFLSLKMPICQNHTFLWQRIVFSILFQVKKNWHLFNILFQCLQKEVLCFFISETLSVWNIITVKSKTFLNEKDQHLKVRISTRAIFVGDESCLFVSFCSLWGSWVLSQFGRGIWNIPKPRKWENSFLPYIARK